MLSTLGEGIHCWGKQIPGTYNNNGFDSDVQYPTAVSGASGIVQVDSNNYNTCAVTSKGELLCWGENRDGQLGNGNTTDALITGPQWVRGVDNSGRLSDVVQVATGESHVCALLKNGRVNCWGNPLDGRLGIDLQGNSNSDRKYPHEVVGGEMESAFLENIVQIALGTDFSCALTSQRKVLCWGVGVDGKLGNGSNASSNSPVWVHGESNIGHLSNVIQISSGRTHNCALKFNGEVRCWGSNSRGALGIGEVSSLNSFYPKKVVGVGGSGILSNVVQITLSIEFTCALKSDGKVNCWGYGDNGRLGLGTSNRSVSGTSITWTNYDHPREVHEVDDAVELSSSGNKDTCVLTRGEVMKCWGGTFTTNLGLPNDIPLSATVAQYAPGIGRASYVCRDKASRCNLSKVVLASNSGQANPNNLAAPVFNVRGLDENESIAFYSNEDCSTALPGGATLDGVTATNPQSATLGITDNEEHFLFYKLTETSVSDNICFKTDFAFDRIVPSNPTVAVETSGDDPPAMLTTPTIVVTGESADAGDTVKVYIGDTSCSEESKEVGSGTADASGIVNVAVPSDFAYPWPEPCAVDTNASFTFHAKITDQVGNVSDCVASAAHEISCPESPPDDGS